MRRVNDLAKGYGWCVVGSHGPDDGRIVSEVSDLLLRFGGIWGEMLEAKGETSEKQKVGGCESHYSPKRLEHLDLDLSWDSYLKASRLKAD